MDERAWGVTSRMQLWGGWPRATALVIVACLLAAGCQSRVKGQNAGVVSSPGTAAAATEQPVAGSTGAPATAAPAGRQPASTPTPASRAVEEDDGRPTLPPESDDGEIAVELTLEPRCAKPGQTMTATVKTDPYAFAMFTVNYADEKEREEAAYEEADASGKAVHRWVLAGDVPDGEHLLTVAVSSIDGGEFAYGPFKTARKGACT